MGSSFSYQINATNNPTSYSISRLPAGLSLNKKTGKITVTPVQTESFFKAEVKAASAMGFGRKTVIFEIVKKGGGVGSGP